ncbi:MAG: hypothetical protein P1P81_09805, partial [Desulfobulbales bacterium]|nr:hypothetical protein [Desulfobulbales bacterium]
PPCGAPDNGASAPNGSALLKGGLNRTLGVPRWQLVDIPSVLSTSLPPCICAVLERSWIQDKNKNAAEITDSTITGPENGKA